METIDRDFLRDNFIFENVLDTEKDITTFPVEDRPVTKETENSVQGSATHDSDTVKKRVVEPLTTVEDVLNLLDNLSSSGDAQLAQQLRQKRFYIEQLKEYHRSQTEDLEKRQDAELALLEKCSLQHFTNDRYMRQLSLKESQQQQVETAPSVVFYAPDKAVYRHAAPATSCDNSQQSHQQQQQQQRQQEGQMSDPLHVLDDILDSLEAPCVIEDILCDECEARSEARGENTASSDDPLKLCTTCKKQIKKKCDFCPLHIRPRAMQDHLEMSHPHHARDNQSQQFVQHVTTERQRSDNHATSKTMSPKTENVAKDKENVSSLLRSRESCAEKVRGVLCEGCKDRRKRLRLTSPVGMISVEGRHKCIDCRTLLRKKCKFCTGFIASGKMQRHIRTFHSRQGLISQEENN